MEAYTLRPGTELQNGKYSILSVLGQGGFGITYEAEQVLLHRKVAVKEFFMKDCCERDGITSHVTVGTGSQRDLVAKFRGKFFREAQMIAGFDHPNIVRILDVFEENGTAYYVMENLPGGSLTDIIKNQGALLESKAEEYIRQVADALNYIHAKNTLHLDVKPSNILLNAKGEAVLIDFGVSKHYDNAGEQTSSTPVGTSKGYAPIEQNLDGDVSQFKASTDIYALGATFYFLITGAVPPDAAIVNEEGLQKPVGVSDRVWNVVKQSMQPRRKDRPQTVKEFLALFDRRDATTGSLEEMTVVKISARYSPKGLDNKGSYEKQKKEHLPIITIIYLSIGLAVGTIILSWLLLIIYDITSAKQLDTLDIEMLLIAIGISIGWALGMVGIILLLIKKKIGFVMFATGGVLAVLSASCAGLLGYIIWELIGGVIATLTLLLAVTYGVLQIKNKHGHSGWSLLRPIRSRSISSIQNKQ